jgi:hypothetical protein
MGVPHRSFAAVEASDVVEIGDIEYNPTLATRITRAQVELAQ